jgi:hypothetical protein
MGGCVGGWMEVERSDEVVQGEKSVESGG